MGARSALRVRAARCYKGCCVHRSPSCTAPFLILGQHQSTCSVPLSGASHVLYNRTWHSSTKYNLASSTTLCIHARELVFVLGCPFGLLGWGLGFG
jgi:hypothetical protein